MMSLMPPISVETAEIGPAVALAATAPATCETSDIVV